MALFGTLESLNLPSKSVIVPLVVPLTTTLAPITASLFESKTLPEITLFCAEAPMANADNQVIKKDLPDRVHPAK